MSTAPQTFGCEVITGGRVRRIGGARWRCRRSGRPGGGVDCAERAADITRRIVGVARPRHAASRG